MILRVDDEALTRRPVDPNSALVELAIRREAQSSLEAWCRLLGYEPAAHHRLMIASMQAMCQPEPPYRNLMLFLPPGAAKSTYGSVCFASWAMQFGWNIIAASHTSSLAKRWSKQVRQKIREKGHLLDIGLGDEAVDRWSTTLGNEYMMAGVTVGIAGFRADLGLIDDPVRNRQDADSELVRERHWEWYNDDFLTRTVPGARKILIQTRWHEDDLAGRLLEHEPEDWHVISIPAECDSADDPLGRGIGDFLWADDDYGYAEDLRKKKKNALPRTWAALYQQKPAPDEGVLFKAEWFGTYEKMPDPKTMRVYGASDFAVSEDKGDYTVHVVVGIGPGNKMYLLDVWRAQKDAAVSVQAFLDLVKKWKPIAWSMESGQIDAAVGPFMRRMMMDEKVYVQIKKFPTKYDKAVRAQSIIGRMALGGILLPTGTTWRPEFERELLIFDAGKHDDQVDAMALLGLLLDVMVAGKDVPEEMPKRPMIGMAGVTLDRLWKDNDRRIAGRIRSVRL